MSLQSERLEYLQLGEKEATNYCQGSDALPWQLDEDKVRRGQRFFQKNNTNCIMAMLCSLVAGQSVSNLLDSLVFTGQSNTAKKSLKRYLNTLKYIMKWHYGDICNEHSESRSSLEFVHKLHDNVRKEMSTERNDRKMYLSQYDMSLVQSGFIGAIIMYPESFGIRCTKAELDDYVYCWRWIGHLLGISEQNNICSKGYEYAYQICKDIEEHILYPSLKNPPSDFYPMAKAFTDGINRLTFLPIFAPEPVINISLDAMNRPRLYKMTFKDGIRIFLLRGIIFLLEHVTKVKALLNFGNEKMCGLR